MVDTSRVGGRWNAPEDRVLLARASSVVTSGSGLDSLEFHLVAEYCGAGTFNSGTVLSMSLDWLDPTKSS